MVFDTKKNKIWFKKEWWIFVFLITLVVVSKLPSINLPVFWDEQTYMDNSLAIYNNGFNPFISNVYSYRPPLILLLGAFAFKLFGIFIFSLRSLTLMFSCIAVCFTYLIGKELYDQETGFWAALLLFSSPIFFAQSGLFLEGIPVTALTASTVYFYIKDKKIMYILSAALFSLTREVGVLVIMAIAGFELLLSLIRIIQRAKGTTVSHEAKTSGLKALFYALPLIFFGGWVLMNKVFFGWFFWPENAKILSNFGFSLVDLRTILANAFCLHFRYLISTAIIAGVLFSAFNSKYKAKFVKKEFLLFLILTFGNVFFYVWVEFVRNSHGNLAVLPRYYLFLQVLFFVFGAAAIVRMFNSKVVRSAIFAVIVGLFIYSWFTPDFIWAGERNLSHRDIIKAHKKAAEFLERNYYTTPIITHWPINRDLTELKLGYVKRRLLKVYDINYEKSSIAGLVNRIRSENPSVISSGILLVISQNCAPNEEMLKFLLRKDNNLVKEIDLGIEKVWIYRL
jgi:4-amino-4-deoxy-L-arabinose transferase-like glycosyltransferase